MPVTLTTLVTGPTPAARETAIASAIDPSADTVVILEGLPSNAAPLESLGGNGRLQLARIAPGCPCCSGNMTLRVTLNRLLRRKPARLFIALVSDSHISRLRQFLMEQPYAGLLQLTDDLTA